MEDISDLKQSADVEPEVSLIVPTINESENLPVLLAGISKALAGASFEVIVVDDNSKDATPQVCAELAKTYPLKLMVRTRPANGLSGAVLHGMAVARGKYLCVMDADLQHPPEKLPELLGPLRSGEADFVLGSRYMPGGSTATKWGIFRKMNSQLATLLARLLAGKTTDPMAGFFALKRETYAAAQNLTPLGYKIALELMCKCRVQTIREIPIHFGMRTRGQSKLSLKQQFRYLEHLSRLYDFKYPRASPVLKFLIATGAGWFVGAVAFFLLISSRTPAVASVAWAYLAGLFVTAVFHVRYVRTQREFLARQTPWLDFAVISAGEWVVATLAAWWMIRNVLQPPSGELFIFCFGCGTLARYILRKEFLQDIRGLRKNLPREAEADQQEMQRTTDFTDGHG
jgi:dolichol-phosphate mannosyltransferase